MPVSDQGVNTNRYKLIPRVLIFVNRGDSVLLIKGSPDKRLWANLYNGIGGHVEKGEDIFSAAQREFLEETGLKLINPWLCAVITIDTGENTGIGMYVFRGEASSAKPSPSPEGTIEWIPAKEITDFPLVEDLHILVPKIMELYLGAPPLFLHYYYDENNNLFVRQGDDVLS